MKAPPGLNYDEFDLVFVSDPVICRLDLKKFRNAVKVYWSHDCIYDRTKYVQLAGTLLDGYDYIFVAHKACLKEYKELTGAKVEWLPYAFSPEIFRPHKVEKIFDISFVGGFSGIGANKRINTISFIIKSRPELKVLYGYGIYLHDLARIYSQSKIVLNISRVGESNLRDFEVLGCGSALLRDYSDEVAEIFRDRVHLMFYRDLDDLLDRIDEMLHNEALRERIAAEGYREAMAKHTLDHRIKYVLEKIGYGDIQ
ncbi:MAG: glycosyltransferase [Sulfolobales archaeon]